MNTTSLGDNSSVCGRTLRERLREDTRGIHETTEAVFQAADHRRLSGYVRLLATHGAALRVFEDVFRRANVTAMADETRRLSGLIKEDLMQLGAPYTANTRPSVAVTARSEAEAQGFAYVLLGSRMGSQILAREALSAEAPHALRSTLYLSDRGSLSHWSALTKTLSACPANGVAADTTMAAAVEAFACFTVALKETETEAA